MIVHECLSISAIAIQAQFDILLVKELIVFGACCKSAMAHHFGIVVLAMSAIADAFLGKDLQSPNCPPANFSTVQNFDLTSFVNGRWYIQQQMAVSYLPVSQNRCVYAEYSLLPKKSFWGYDIQVHNYAEDVAPPYEAHDSGSLLCAKVVDSSAGKLEVAPCFLPSFFAGPYWVLAFSQDEGYALISGGAPTHSAVGGCRTGTGVNDAGLWIFTRQQQRDEALVSKVRGIASAKGFDLSVLNNVNQTECSEKVVV